jgi:hypothetical protein
MITCRNIKHYVLGDTLQFKHTKITHFGKIVLLRNCMYNAVLQYYDQDGHMFGRIPETLKACLKIFNSW